MIRRALGRSLQVRGGVERVVGVQLLLETLQHLVEPILCVRIIGHHLQPVGPNAEDIALSSLHLDEIPIVRHGIVDVQGEVALQRIGGNRGSDDVAFVVEHRESRLQQAQVGREQVDGEIGLLLCRSIGKHIYITGRGQIGGDTERQHARDIAGLLESPQVALVLVERSLAEVGGRRQGIVARSAIEAIGPARAIQLLLSCDIGSG